MIETTLATHNTCPMPLIKWSSWKTKKILGNRAGPATTLLRVLSSCDPLMTDNAPQNQIRETCVFNLSSRSCVGRVLSCFCQENGRALSVIAFHRVRQPGILPLKLPVSTVTLNRSKLIQDTRTLGSSFTLLESQSHFVFGLMRAQFSLVYYGES